MRFLKFIFIVLISVSCTVPPLFASDTSYSDSWTLQDVDAVADAYVKASETHKSTAANTITLSLAEALIKAGDAPKAKQVLVEAARFGTEDDFINGEIVEKLAGLKAYEDAQQIVAASKDDHNRILRLGMLGVGYVHSENYAGALKAAADINVVAKINGLVPVAQNEFNFGEPEIAIGRIARELAKSGAVDEALKLANTLPDRSFKLQVIGQAASTLCSTKKDIVGNPAKGRALAEQAKKLATLELTTVNFPYDTVDRLVTAGEAVLTCEGVAEAKSFFTITAPLKASEARDKLTDQLWRNQKLDLSRTIAPQPDPNNAESLLNSAELLINQKNMVAAKEEAKKALHVAVNNQNNQAFHMSKTDYDAQLGRISGVLSEVGDYDEAIAINHSISGGGNEHEFFNRIIHMQIEKHDTVALERTIPLAIQAFEQPTPIGDRSAAYLAGLISDLFSGGYKDEAVSIYKQKQQELWNAAKKGNQLRQGEMAALLVIEGDVKGAYEVADSAGPLTSSPSPQFTTMLTVMQFDGAKELPTPAQILAARQRAKAMEPKLVAGPKAGAFAGIAEELAIGGDIKGAMQAVSRINCQGPDKDQTDALTGTCDTALKSIAEAQMKSGDLRGAFSTALRISQPLARSDVLLKLVVRPTTGKMN